MATKDSPSWTTRIGGNRTIVLGIMILMLCLFTVEDYILKAVGLGSGGTGFVKFRVHGREVALDAGKYHAQIQEWRRFQMGQWRMQRGDPRTGEKPEPRTGEQEFLTDIMMAELARDAGVAVPDATLREYLEAHPAFQDDDGNFDPKVFDARREMFFGGIGSRALEEEFRRHLLLGHFKRIYANTFLAVTDDEIYRKWKSDHPKLEAAYAWAPVGPLRAAMKPESATAEEVEAHWKDERVQKRHRTPRKYAFDAAWILVSEVEDKAYLEAREHWKAEPGLSLGESEAFEYWSARRDFDFRDAPEKPELLETLRKENEARVKKEDEEAAKKNPASAVPDAPKEDPGAVGAPAAGFEPGYADFDGNEQFRRYWRFRIEKEVWLRRLLDKVRVELEAPDATVAKAAAKWSRPGLQIRTLVQETPVDQMEVEKLPGVGGPNCPLRYSLTSKNEGDLGKPHDSVLTWSAISDDLSVRGWLVYLPRKIVPDAVPPLESVRDKIVGEVLDEKARTAARVSLETLRRDAEAGRKSLEDAAKEKGLESARIGPFNEYTWRPPARPKEDGKEEPAGEGWKSAERRASTVMGRYGSFRDTPVDAFSSVMDDAKGTGAYYLAQVKSRTDPAFEEMTQAQISQVRRLIIQERMEVVEQEWSYGRMRERYSLEIDGKPAPAPEERETREARR